MESLYTLTSIKAFKKAKAERRSFLKKGTKTVQIDDMIEVAKQDPLIARFINMPGDNEKIMTGELFNTPWKIRIDKLAEPDMIIDWKTCASITEMKWDSNYGRRATFIERYGYARRGAVYREIYYQQHGVYPSFLLICVSKESPPDKAVILINHQQTFSFEMEQIKNNLIRINAIRKRQFKPLRCDKCEYCRMTKKISTILTADQINPEFAPPRVEEYDELWEE